MIREENYCVIITTTDNKEVCDLIVSILLEQKLAACIQIDMVNSAFLWDNMLHKIDEYRLMIKTSSNHYTLIEECIKKLHNYQIPQIVKINIDDGTKEYLNWIKNNVLM